MKAEHRKELQTNLLADRMGRLVQGVRSGPQANSTVVWTIGLLAVGVLIAWLVYSKTPRDRSNLWISLNDNDNPKALGDLASENPNTLPARYAQFRKARVLLQQGLVDLYPDRKISGQVQTSQRTKAVADVEEARNLYESLGAEVKPLASRGTDNALLLQEALLGSAKAEEALTDIPISKEGEGSRGSLDRALARYRDYLDRARPDGFQDKTVADTIQELDKKGNDQNAEETRWLAVARHVQGLEANSSAEAKKFYADLNAIAATETKNLP